MENIENVKLFINSLDGSIDQLQEKLQPIINRPLDELIGSHTQSPLEAIKLYNNYLYTLISILFAYLKVIGIKVEEHPIMKELSRIKSYMKRLKDLEAKLNNADEKTKVDSEHTKRFIENTLGAGVNGGGAAKPDSLNEPAISKANFQGKHTKFDDNKSDDEVDARANKSSKSHAKAMKPTSSGRIAKPKHRKANK